MLAFTIGDLLSASESAIIFSCQQRNPELLNLLMWEHLNNLFLSSFPPPHNLGPYGHTCGIVRHVMTGRLTALHIKPHLAKPGNLSLLGALVSILILWASFYLNWFLPHTLHPDHSSTLCDPSAPPSVIPFIPRFALTPFPNCLPPLPLRGPNNSYRSDFSNPSFTTNYFWPEVG